MPNIPRSPPRWTRGDVGREIGKWILAEIREALLLAGIDGRVIDGSHVKGVIPTAVTKMGIYIDNVLCDESSNINFTDNFECAPDNPYFTGTGGQAAVDLSNTGVVAGAYGDDTHIPLITIDAKGRVTVAGEVEVAEGSTSTFVFRFSTTTSSGDPGSGYFRLDDTTFLTATAIMLDILTDNSIDITNLLNSLRVGDTIYMQTVSPSTNWVRYEINA